MIIMLLFMIPVIAAHELAHILLAKKRGLFLEFKLGIEPKVISVRRENPSRFEHLEGILANFLLYPVWLLLGLNILLYPIIVLVGGSLDIINWHNHHKRWW